MKIYESTYYQFDLDENLIVNRWKNNTDKMTYQDFKDALMNLAGFIIEHRTLNVLIDTTNFKFELPPENLEFRDNDFYPRIKKIGEVKQAIVIPEEYLHYVEDEIISTAIVPTRYFSDESEATAWLAGSK